MQISIPVNVGSLVKKTSALKKLVKKLKSLDPSDLLETRVELSVQGYCRCDGAAQQARHYMTLDGLPNGVQISRMIWFASYITEIGEIIKDIEKMKMFGGRYGSKVTALQKHHLAKLFNSIGFSMGRRIRHLKEPSTQ